MIEVIAYTNEQRDRWDNFVKDCKNTHFLFLRDYIEYHADRFIDNSLLFIEQDKVLAALPANKQNDKFISHGGLTFGGFIVDLKIKTQQVLEIFSALLNYLKLHDFKTLLYKAIPYIYHLMPSQEDLYALLLNNAKLIRRDVSSTIDLKHKLNFSGGKRNGIAKAKKNGIKSEETKDFSCFNAMVNKILTEKYATKATHNTDEMFLLATRFPNNIKLHGAFLQNEMVAGVLIYLTETVAHTQYMATTQIGRDLGALDYLLDILINDIYKEKRYFDFGISTEQQGKFLNQGLISQKEMFGARAVMYDTYELTIS